MKRYIYGFFALLTAMLSAWTLTSCADDVEPFMTEESGTDCFNLVVKVPDEAASRATDAELSLNEFKVTTLHFYFYKSADHDDATSPSVYDYVWTGEFNTTKTIQVALPANALLDGGLFGLTGTNCIVYTVANVDTSILPAETPKTIDELKATAVSSTFDQTKVQESFAMDGRNDNVTIDRATRRATGTITLKRAAAKITLSVDLPQKITVTINQGDGSTSEREYSSNADAMHVWISKGVKKSKLNTAAEPAAAVDTYSNEMEAKDGSGAAFTRKEAMEKYKYVQNVPFYSYPNKWEATSPDGNCYLTLVVPWSYKDASGSTQQIPTYYRIPVQPEECVIERNMHYDIRVTIGRLGSTEPQKPIDVTVDWNYALEWKDHTLATDIKEVRYLLLNNNYYDDETSAYAFEMNNETSIEIPVGTSHDVEIAEVKMSWIDYSINPPETRTNTLTPDGDNKYSDLAGYTESTQESIVAGIEVDNGESKLKLKREMLHLKGGGQKWVEDRYEWQRVDGSWQRVLVEPAHWEDVPIDITTEAALNSYTFDIKLQHADDDSQTAMVHITQYPPIYITAEETTDGNTRFVNKNNTNSTVSERVDGRWQEVDKGYIYMNPNQDPQIYGDYNLGTVHDNYAKNKNTYVISISRFDNGSDKDYIIADPRTRSVNNLTYTDDTEATALWSIKDDKNAQLKYYYPADDSSDKERYIAPKLRIASQWGVTFDMTRNGALRRCASYQENGRPAGRWRVPTVAEIEFIAALSCKKYIPFLFGTEENKSGSDKGPADYWCASGGVLVDNNPNNPRAYIDNSSTTRRSVRCVYDEWYWGDDVLADKTKFTWGDKERTTFGNQ